MRAQIYMQLIALCMLLACSCYGDEVCHSESSLNCLPLTCSGSTFCCHIETAQVDDDTCFNSCCSLDSTTTTALRTTTTTTTSRRSGSEYDDESLQSVHFRRVVLGGLILFCCVPGLVIVAWFLRFITAFCQGRAIRSDLERLRQQEATATPELVVVSEIELEKASLPKLQACAEDADSNSMHTERMLAAVKHLNAQPKGCSVADCTYCQTDLQCPICLSSTIDSKPTFTPCFHVSVVETWWHTLILIRYFVVIAYYGLAPCGTTSAPHANLLSRHYLRLS